VFWFLEKRTISIYRAPRKASKEFQFTSALILEKASGRFQFTGSGVRMISIYLCFDSRKSVRAISIYRLWRPDDFNLPLL
jgi:hypothetical protein|tara:strand:- start:188 stop:427 length:240 start_codon:yes stop_codon:yes gene_type:complete